MGIQCRFDQPGSFHHVISRAVDGLYIFREYNEQSDFIRRLELLVEEDCFKIHAWVLMSNHFHLLLEVRKISLSCSMQRLLTGYSMRFNRINNRQGHVFQSRFRSILVDRESYLKELVRYIHLNPLRAHIVDTVNSLRNYYPNGHNHIISVSSNSWQSTELMEAEFSNVAGKSDWIWNYIEFLNDGVSSDSRRYENGNYIIDRNGLHDAEHMNDRVSDKGAARIIGTDKFVRHVYSEVQGIRKILVRDRKEQHQIILNVTRDVSEATGIPIHALRSSGGGNRISRVRGILVKILIDEIGISKADTARYLKLSGTSVTRYVESIDDPSTVILRNVINRSNTVQ